jgi:hypothetical protein
MQPSKLPAPLNFQLLTDGAAAVNSRRIRMKNKIIVVLVMASAWVLAVPAAHAQAASKDSPTVTDQDIQLLRQDLRSNATPCATKETCCSDKMTDL